MPDTDLFAAILLERCVAIAMVCYLMAFTLSDIGTYPKVPMSESVKAFCSCIALSPNKPLKYDDQ